MLKLKNNNNKTASVAGVSFRRSAIALAVVAGFSGNAASATNGTTLPDSGESGEFSVGVAGTGYDSSGTAPTYTKVGSNVGVINLNANAKAILKWENLGVANDQTLTFSDSHGTASVVLNKVQGQPQLHLQVL